VRAVKHNSWQAERGASLRTHGDEFIPRPSHRHFATVEGVRAHWPNSLEEENPVVSTIHGFCASTQSLDQFLVGNES
jgi:hypothetical protein